MGNTSLSPQTTSQLLNKYWQPLSTNTYRNISTHQIIQQKRLFFKNEQQMKHVFNSLVKRMHNFSTSVIKVVYLRKFGESSSLCHCSKTFHILVYLQQLEMNVGEYVQQLKNNTTERQKQPTQNNSISSSKCICLQVLKGAQYLKQRYGPFKLTANNIWLDIKKKSHQINHSQQQKISSLSNKKQHPQNLKAKIWISAQKQQNFPDQSCQQKEMVESIIQLIEEFLVPSNLCKCYNLTYSRLKKYREIHKIKELVEKISRDHSSSSQSFTNNIIAKAEINHENIKTIPFQRTVRSFSSNQPSYNHNLPLQYISHREEQPYPLPQRKYTSIEFIRKPPQGKSIVSGKKVSKAPQTFTEFNQFFNPNPKPTIQQQQYHPKSYSFQQHNNKINQNSLKNDRSLITSEHQNNNNQTTKFQNSQKNLANVQQNAPFIYHQKTSHSFNPKLKYRHGNTIYNRPIINISDLSLSQYPQQQVPSILISRNHNKKITEDEITQKSHSQEVFRQLATEREINNNRERQNMSKIDDFMDEMSKKCIQISLDKGTSPTDRTKNQISTKGEDKKQTDAINSVLPISLQSTYGAASCLKPILHSHDHIHKPISTPVSNSQLQLSPKQHTLLNHHHETTKKQSISSSKSQQNYTMTINYQINLLENNQINNINKGKGLVIIPKKNTSNHYHYDQSKGSSTERKSQEQHQQAHRPKAHSFLNNKIQTLATPNGDMGRLRQSEYIISGQNSIMNSKAMSVKQASSQDNKIEQQEKNINYQVGSLAEMQANFPTVNDLTQLQEIQVQKSQSNTFKQENITKVSHFQQIPQQIISPSKKPSSISLVDHYKNKSHSSNTNDPRARVPTQKLQHIINSKVSSLIMRQHQQPFYMQKVTQEEYRVNVRVDKNNSHHHNDKQKFQQKQKQKHQKMHHKKLSNPTFDKQYMKNKSLKQQFSHLLDFPNDNNSFKALTESKQNKLTLNQNQGRQTYSIYNQSQYNTSDQNVSKRQSQHQITGKPPLPQHQPNNQTSWRKPFAKDQLREEQQQKQISKKDNKIQQQKQYNNNIPALRLTSSGHQDNSIKQKVRNKKAEFAQLKNQMNSLLF